MSSTDHIRYDVLAQEAMRGVLRRVMTDAAKQGLPGDHHFYITFLTHAPGVKLSPRLMAQYPQEMTIILQHQFWDLVRHGGPLRGRPVVRRRAGAADRAVRRHRQLPRSIGAVRPAVQHRRRGARSPKSRTSRAHRPRLRRHLPRLSRPPSPLRTARPSRAKAPRLCGWIASARNNWQEIAGLLPAF